MQAPDSSNPGKGFLQQPVNSITQISAPKPALPMSQGMQQFTSFPPRPVFSAESSTLRPAAPSASIPSAVPVANVTSTSSAIPAPSNPLAGHPSLAHSSVQLKATVAATALTQPVLSSIAPPMSAISSQSLQGIHPAVTAAVIAGPAAAEGNSTMSASNATPDVPHTMIMPPPVHHTGTTAVPIPYVPSPSLSTYISSNHVAPVPPLHHLAPPSHRPIQAVQPQQVPVVQTAGAPAMATHTAHTPAHPGHLAHPGQQAQQFQRLKVEDALSYLDQVKLQFGNHPQVYNDFLDIMKEFKSQSIDTPGVISRVSNLFRGHPELIVGFNTFLPPGYKIEVQGNDTISVQQPGQPSMSLSQLTGTASASSRPDSHHLPTHHYNKVKPVNLSVNAPGPSSVQNSDMPRSMLDNVVAAATAPETISSTPGQPVEFNHAISYVNKIKNRFQGQPDIYKNFLEILHKYQKEQRQIKDGTIAPSGKPLTETEVYSQVAKLFQNQEDLLKEFGQFLPDANGQGGFFSKGVMFGELKDPPVPVKSKQFSITGKRDTHTSSKLSSSSSTIRKYGSSGMGGAAPPSKKPKLSTATGVGGNKEFSLADAGKYGTLSEYAFFDKVKKVLRSQEVYDNFLRCIVLFNSEVLTRSELLQLCQPFLGKFPELQRRFKDILGYKEDGSLMDPISATSISGMHIKPERSLRDDLAMEIDYSSCKRYGHSYRALPKAYTPVRCSGRTTLCREVLNDSWVSFPSWSEESTFVTSRKTTYEENIYRCEDERFELDVVIELNMATIKVLESVQQKLQKMSSDEAAKYKLENNLGGSSDVIHRKAIHRIYGDKAVDIIEGLKKNPVVAVPLVLRRLKGKDEEWKEAQRQFNKVWREQNEKFYLKSLDHQGINFKQNDTKALRSKSLLNEIEAIYEAEQNNKRDSADASGNPIVIAPTAANAEKQPHLTFTYKNLSTVDDAMNLIIHHARRQASIQKEDKRLIKQLLRQNIQKFFHRSVVPLSDDEDDDDDSEEDEKDGSKPSSPMPAAEKSRRSSSRVKASASSASNKETEDKKSHVKTEAEEQDDDLQASTESSNKYSLFYANSNWYLFLRLHQILCQRLSQIKGVCDRLVKESLECEKNKSDSIAVALRLRLPSDVEPQRYYSNFLELVKSLLDGNIECSHYEDQLRDVFGIHAYITFTMDKLIQNAVKQLQYIVTDDLCRDVTDNWIKEVANNAAGGDMCTRSERISIENIYKKNMENLISEDNCFEITMYQKDNLLAISLLDTDTEDSIGSVVGHAEKWHDYIDKYLPGDSDPELTDEVKEHLKRKPIFLKHNIRSWEKANAKSAMSKSNLQLSSSSAKLSGQEEGCDAPSSVVDTTKTTESESNTNGEIKQQIDSDKTAPCDLPDDLDIREGEQCKLNLGSYKMVKVVKSEDYLYRKEAFTRAAKTHKKVSQAMHKKWAKFCGAWKEKNTTPTESSKIKSWLDGEDLEDCRPCQTVCIAINDLDNAPYRLYNRYSVRYEKVTAAVTTAIDDGSLTALTAASDEVMDTV